MCRLTNTVLFVVSSSRLKRPSCNVEVQEGDERLEPPAAAVFVDRAVDKWVLVLLLGVLNNHGMSMKSSMKSFNIIEWMYEWMNEWIN